MHIRQGVIYSKCENEKFVGIRHTTVLEICPSTHFVRENVKNWFTVSCLEFEFLWKRTHAHSNCLNGVKVTHFLWL